MRERSGISSTRKRGSFSRVSVNSGFSIPIRPTSARYCASSSDIGETPHGRYLSSQGNSLSRFDPSTSQIRKWVSSRIVTVFFGRSTRGPGFLLANPNSTDQLDRHQEHAGDVYSQENCCFDFVTFLSSLRKTSLCPFRSRTTTSPAATSSSTRNQFFLASEAVSLFICTMYNVQLGDNDCQMSSPPPLPTPYLTSQSTEPGRKALFEEQ